MVNSDALIEPADTLVEFPRPSQGGPASARAARALPAPTERIQWLARSRSWVSLLLLVPAGIVTAGSPLQLASDGIPDMTCQALAWAAFMAGAVLRWWATLYIGGRKTAELVTSGAYSICRNPIYLGTFLMQMSVVLFVESLTLGVATLLVAAYYLGVTVTAEERRLAAIHGQEFQTYKKQVPRFSPSARHFRTASVISVETAGLRSELVRMLRWMWIPAVCQLLNAAREHQWWAPFTNWP